MEEMIKETFLRDGYVLVPNVLSAAEINAARDALTAPLAYMCNYLGLASPGEDWPSIHRAYAALKNHDQPRYINVLKIAQNDGRILSIANAPGLRAALHAVGLEMPVVALKPFPVVIAPDLHIEGGYNLRPFHQEWPVMQGSTDGVVAWTPLHDITDDHNALEVIPGSHVHGALDYERTTCGTSVIAAQMPDTAPLRISMQAGDTLIFSTFTLHGTSPLGSRLRAAVTIRYNNLASPSFIQRGYPDPSKVVIDRQPANYYKPAGIND